jgi:hypothetical protein
LQPFNAIKAISSSTGDVSYPQLLTAQGTSITSPSCLPARYMGSTAGLVTYNVTAERQIYDLFNQKVAAYPDLGAFAEVYHEGYANAAARAVDPASSAYPHRDDNHLVYVNPILPITFTHIYCPVSTSGEIGVLTKINADSSLLWSPRGSRISRTSGPCRSVIFGTLGNQDESHRHT